MSDREPIGIETSEGKHLVSAHDMLLLAREWQQWEQADEARRKGATAIAMVFSMPPGTDPELVRAAVDRKSVVSGTRGSVRVDLGGGRVIKNKKNVQQETQ